MNRLVLAAGIFGFGLAVVGCGGEGGEGPIVPPPPAPAEYADKHMPAGWWSDPKIIEEGRELYIGGKNPDVNCASCHGKDGKPVKAGARDFRNGDRMKLYSGFGLVLAHFRGRSQYEDEALEEQVVRGRSLEDYGL